MLTLFLIKLDFKTCSLSMAKIWNYNSRHTDRLTSFQELHLLVQETSTIAIFSKTST